MLFVNIRGLLLEKTNPTYVFTVISAKVGFDNSCQNNRFEIPYYMKVTSLSKFRYDTLKRLRF